MTEFQGVTTDFTWRSYKLRPIWSYLKEKERIYKTDILRFRESGDFERMRAAKSRYDEITAIMIWMVANIPDGY